MIDVENMAGEAAAEVQLSYGMGGLCGGLYEEFATDVAKIVAQAVARRCAEIAEATTEHGEMDMHGETRAYATAAAIRAEFGIEGE